MPDKPQEFNGLLKMDQLAIRCLEIMEEIIQERSNLDGVLKNAFICMAQARYSMGKNSVSTLQLPTEDYNVDARIKVLVSDSEDSTLVKSQHYSLYSPTTTEDSSEETKTVRQRNKEAVSEDNDDDRKKRTETPKSPKEKSFDKKDPLHWFGILVPSPLRECQAGFKQALPILCNVASLQNELHEVCAKFREFRVEKKLGTLKIADETEC